jgi:hypothetical protein
LHERQERFAHEHRSVQVDAHHALPELEVEFVPGRVLEDAGVIDKYVEVSVLVCHLRAHGFDARRVADIERRRDAGVACLRDESRGRGQIAEACDVAAGIVLSPLLEDSP